MLQSSFLHDKQSSNTHMTVVPPWESLCSAAVCRGRWEECKAWMRERETSPALHPTTGTGTLHYTLIACSWPHETWKHPAKHTNTPLIHLSRIWNPMLIHYCVKNPPYTLPEWRKTSTTSYTAEDDSQSYRPHCPWSDQHLQRESETESEMFLWVNTKTLYVYLHVHHNFPRYDMFLNQYTCWNGRTFI